MVPCANPETYILPEYTKTPAYSRYSLEALDTGAEQCSHTTQTVTCLKSKKNSHKSILRTMKYIRMIYFENNEFEVGTATTIEEAKQLLIVGYDYVT